MPRRLVQFLVLACAGLFAGCAASGESGETDAPRGVIGLSVLTANNPFFNEIADSLREEAARHGYGLFVVSGDNDAAKQQNQVKDFIVRDVAAIVLTPCDSKAVGPAIREANAAGIPVFTADIACLAPDAEVVTHVATDNYGGGRAAAQAMLEALGGRGKVAIVDYPEVESVILRTRGFEDEMAEANKQADVNVEIVAKLPGGGNRELGNKAAQDILQAHDDLAGIFAINDPSALGARAAVESAGREDQVVIIGFDGQLEGKQAIKQGKIYADPIQFPDKIGNQTARAIAAYFEGEQPVSEILIPTKLYRKTDAEHDPALR